MWEEEVEKSLERSWKNNEGQKDAPRQKQERKNIKDYTFKVNDTERWFDVFVK